MKLAADHDRVSLQELETQLLASRRLSYASERQADELLEKASEIGRLIDGLYRSLMPAARV